MDDIFKVGHTIDFDTINEINIIENSKREELDIDHIVFIEDEPLQEEIPDKLMCSSAPTYKKFSDEVHTPHFDKPCDCFEGYGGWDCEYGPYPSGSIIVVETRILLGLQEIHINLMQWKWIKMPKSGMEMMGVIELMNVNITI